MNSSIYSLLHNESALYILNNIQSIPSGQNNVKSTVKILNQDFLSRYDIAFEDYALPIFPPNSNDIDLRQWIAESSQSNDLKGFVNQTIDILEQELPQVDYYNQLDNLLNTADGVLTSNDKIKFQDSILVAKRSYELWFSEIGGQREWLSELRNIDLPNPNDVVASINWWKVLGVDIVGGIVSAGNPVGFLGASTIAVIMMW